MNIHLLLRNAIDFPLRQLFRWRRKGLVLAQEDRKDLFALIPPSEKTTAERLAARLIREYHLENSLEPGSNRKYLENLYYLELLEKALRMAQVEFCDSVHAADIGVADWFYVQSLAACLRYFGGKKRQIHLDGFEVDAYRVYSDFFSRMDYARAYMGDTPDVFFYPDHFTAVPCQYDLVTQFFPFVFMKDHLKWGLPAPMFDPGELLNLVIPSLKAGGVLVIVNQGEDEHSTQMKLLETHCLQPVHVFRHESVLFSYYLPRYVIVGIKSCPT